MAWHDVLKQHLLLCLLMLSAWCSVPRIGEVERKPVTNKNFGLL